MKTCSKCKESKASKFFNKDRNLKSGLSSWCKECFTTYRRSNPDKIRNAVLKCDYGISLKDYNEMLSRQNYSCAICQRHEKEFEKRLHVDHCHKTGKVRGLLCSNCNGVLGKFADNRELFERAALYLNTQYNIKEGDSKMM